MSRRGRRVAVVAVALLAVIGPSIAGAQPLRCAGRPLSAVLADLAGTGLRMVYSNRVVLPDMRVRSEPKATTPREILDEILAPHGLRAVKGPAGRWLILRATEPRRPSAKEPSAESAAGTIMVGLRNAARQTPVAVSAADLKGGLGTARVTADGRILIRGLEPGLYYLEAVVSGCPDPEPRAFSVVPGGALDLLIDLEIPADWRRDHASVQPALTLYLTAGIRHQETTDVSVTLPRTDGSGLAHVLPAGSLIDGAGTFENPLRTVQTLPGITSAWDFDSRLVVRGGDPSENLVLIDGVETHSPYRAFGLASPFIPGALESIEVSSGGFDARHGDHLSSVVRVNSREGDRSVRFAGSGVVGLFDSSLVLEGRVPGAWRGSWLAAGRYSFYDLVAGRVLENKVPRSGDVYMKVSVEPRAGRRLSFFGAAGAERMDARESNDPSEDFALRTRSRTALASVTFDTTVGSRAAFRATASYSGVRDAFGIQGMVKSDGRGTAESTPRSDGFAAQVGYAKRVAVRDWAVRQELAVSASDRHAFDFGLDAHVLRTSFGWHIDGDRQEETVSRVLPWPYGVPGASLPERLDSGRKYARAAAFAQYRPAVASWLAPRIGVRFEYSGFNRRLTVSPRAAASLRVGGSTRVSAAMGVYRQSPGYEKLFLSDYFVDLARADRLQSEQALHMVGGIERELAPGLVARIEAFRKSYTHLLAGRLETVDERDARLAAYDFGALDDHLPRERRVTTVPSDEGRGHAHGIEVHLEKTARSGNPRLTGRLSYSYGVANRLLYGEALPFDYDRRHVVHLLWRSEVRPTVVLSGALRIASGIPRTEPVGLHVASRADQNDIDGDGNRNERVPARDSAGNLIYALDFGPVSNINRARSPYCARADARMTFSPGGQHGRWALYVEVVNLLNTPNPGLVTYQVNSTDGNRPQFVRRDQFSIPFLPTVGVRFRF